MIVVRWRWCNAVNIPKKVLLEIHLKYVALIHTIFLKDMLQKKFYFILLLFVLFFFLMLCILTYNIASDLLLFFIKCQISVKKWNLNRKKNKKTTKIIYNITMILLKCVELFFLGGNNFCCLFVFLIFCSSLFLQRILNKKKMYVIYKENFWH